MLRIRASYLDALEGGRLGHLPGKVYTLGFLRSYATSLGLDPEEMVRRFQAETGIGAGHLELAFPTPVAERGLPAGALILLGMLLVGGAYIGWYRLSGEGRLPAEAVTPVPARLATLAEQALSGPDGRVPVPAMPAVAPAKPDDSGMFEPRHAAPENPLLTPEPAPAPPSEVNQAIPAMAVAPTTAIAMPVRHPDREAREQPSGPNAGGEASDSGEGRIVLRFTGETWVQVKERGGQSLVSKLMKAGDVFPVPARPNLVLNTGNAGRIDVVVDGNVVPAIGASGSVRKDVPLDADQLKAGVAVPVAAKR
jgi:cytoskeleton protein RodZ